MADAQDTMPTYNMWVSYPEHWASGPKDTFLPMPLRDNSIKTGTVLTLLVVSKKSCNFQIPLLTYHILVDTWHEYFLHQTRYLKITQKSSTIYELLKNHIVTQEPFLQTLTTPIMPVAHDSFLSKGQTFLYSYIHIDCTIVLGGVVTKYSDFCSMGVISYMLVWVFKRSDNTY